MSRIKQVFNKDEIAHVWVYGNYRGNGKTIQVTNGRSDNYEGYGRCNFNGDEFRSYTTTVAKRYDLGEKGVLFVLNTTSYGPTTASHLRNIRRAIPGNLKGRTIHTIGCRNSGYFPSSKEDKYSWKNAVTDLLDDAKEQLRKAKKSRQNRDYTVASGLNLVTQAETLNDLLDLGVGEEIAQVRADLENLPKYEAKPSDPNKRRYIRDWNEAKEYIPNLPMIAAHVFRHTVGSIVTGGQVEVDHETKVITKVLDGLDGVEGKVTIKLKISECPWANIKIVGDRVLTSLGVRLSREEALDIYEGMLEAVKNLGNRVSGRRYTIQYVYYTGYKSDNKGLISVGCHYFDPSTIASGYLYLVKELGAT